jgi:hypothetical protein
MDGSELYLRFRCISLQFHRAQGMYKKEAPPYTFGGALEALQTDLNNLDLTEQR